MHTNSNSELANFKHIISMQYISDAYIDSF
jgi:hypothetical protein